MIQENEHRSGIVLLDKPAGITSAKAIAILKRRLRCKKIGHAGTLDPMATGLLVCLINGATKLAALAVAGDKVYSGTFLFGVVTDTDDIEGKVISHSLDLPTFDQVQEHLKSFLGTIEQVPPQVSAIKVDGEPLYKRVRRGEEVVITPRSVTIHSFEIFPTEVPEKFDFRIHCSKGTYIRSIARDLGVAVGCGACLAKLRREKSYPFDTINGKKIEEIDASDILDWWTLLPDVGMIELEDGAAQRLKNGDQSLLTKISESFPDVNSVIYGDSRYRYGVLVRETLDGAWKIAVNVV
ncbi:MAG: tRNA pseudouridine(55) synthase TruB [Bdellovibrionota bacterium]|jgi:tRNA pseudouridine55 synthase